MSIVSKIKTGLDRIILSVASILLLILVLGAIWQVVSRYVLGSPSTFTNELLGFLLIWTSLLGASYAFGSNQHLALTFATNKLNKKGQLATTIFVDLIIVLFAVVFLIIGGIDAVNITSVQTTPILGISKGLVYSIIPISGFIIIIYKLLGISSYKKIDQEEGE
ncbi:TRAP transporter small permease [Gracilibacillus oryzae]|uniref:TRAP transporter small permease n=1 Tax=Gracilibacillus oryzae TaxID=1672701 RepID=A0A7C8GSN9_9BACI|nr:TRAP transporter small permease [Gracilibacillus oryzae]KAB8131048.1 TRAP transporter small permease [Gracilibacillus oryzae]